VEGNGGRERSECRGGKGKDRNTKTVISREEVMVASLARRLGNRLTSDARQDIEDFKEDWIAQETRKFESSKLELLLAKSVNDQTIKGMIPSKVNHQDVSLLNETALRCREGFSFTKASRSIINVVGSHFTASYN
jgi:hypothetical protein